MKRILIRRMSLKNFKGIAQLDVDFGSDTSIMGRNGTGKTTVMDAFTWTLFDKDGRDSSKFEVATNDREGNFIPRLVHEVELTLEVDGQTTVLTKRKYDNWVKQRGKTTEEFKGWKTEYLIDSVPMREKDYVERVEQICSYESFKLATIPGYLMTWKTDKRRELLLNMVGGNLTSEDIIGDDRDLQSLVLTLKNKTFEEVNIQTKAEIKRLKKERDDLEPQLRLRSNDIRMDLPPMEEVQREIQEKDNAIARIDEEIRQRTSAVTAAENMRKDVQQTISRKNSELIQRVSKIQNDRRFKLAEAQQNLNNYRMDLRAKESELERLQRRSDELLGFIAKHQEIRKNLLDELATISAERFRPYCPACGQPLEGDSRAQQKLAFYDLKLKRQTEVQKRGQNNNSVIEEYQGENAKILGQMQQVRETIKTLKEQCSVWETKSQISVPSMETVISSSVELANLQKEIKDLESQAGTFTVEKVDISDLQEQQRTVRESLSALNQTLAEIRQNDRLRESMNSIDMRIKQIGTMIANAEMLEDKLNSFSRKRVEMLERRINEMFTMVRFRLFREQVNGGIEEIAEAYVDGVPYGSNLNAGARVNAGIDICNAISKYYQIEAPVFVDNAEGVTDLKPSLSQMVRLIVTNDDNLKVTINKD